jgi:uncharacterized membrane protein YgaE (UPF0421/DUF939 family)
MTEDANSEQRKKLEEIEREIFLRRLRERDAARGKEPSQEERRELERMEKEHYLQGLRNRQAVREANKQLEQKAFEMKQERAALTAQTYLANLEKWSDYRKALEERVLVNREIKAKLLADLGKQHKRRLRGFITRDLHDAQGDEE